MFWWKRKKKSSPEDILNQIQMLVNLNMRYVSNFGSTIADWPMSGMTSYLTEIENIFKNGEDLVG